MPCRQRSGQALRLARHGIGDINQMHTRAGNLAQQRREEAVMRTAEHQTIHAFIE